MLQEGVANGDAGLHTPGNPAARYLQVRQLLEHELLIIVHDYKLASRHARAF